MLRSASRSLYDILLLIQTALPLNSRKIPLYNICSIKQQLRTKHIGKGICCCGLILKTIIFCGNTEISDEDLTQYLMHILTFFTKKNYQLFTNNCRKFSTVVLKHLDTDDNGVLMTLSYLSY